MATHSSVLAWRILGMEEPGGLPSMGSHRVGHDLAAAALQWRGNFGHIILFYFLYITWHCLGQSYLCIFLFPLCLLLLECQTDENRSTVYLSYQAIPRTGLGAPGSLAAEVLEAGRQTDPAPELSGFRRREASAGSLWRVDRWWI